MAVEAGTVEGAPCSIGAGIQPALDIGCDRLVVAGVGAIQLAGDAGRVAADLLGGTGRAKTGLFELDLEGGTQVTLLPWRLKLCDVSHSRISSR